MGVLDTIAGMASKMGSKIAEAPTSEGQGIKATSDNIKEYQKAISGTPEPAAPPKGAEPANADKIHPHSHFGDKPGEKRPGHDDMPSYKHGVDSVPKTGPAMLHKGEKVTPAEDNPMNKDVASLMPGIAGTKPEKKISHLVHRKDETTGKHIVEHHHTHPLHQPTEHHHNLDMSQVHDHVEQMGEPNQGEAEAAAAAPAAAAGPAAAGPAAGAPPAVPGV